LRNTPRVSHTTAAKVLAYVGNVRRFSNTKALAAFIGLTLRRRYLTKYFAGTIPSSKPLPADPPSPADPHWYLTQTSPYDFT